MSTGPGQRLLLGAVRALPDEQAMVRALARARDLFDLAATAGRPRTGAVGSGEAGGFVFPCGAETVAKLEGALSAAGGVTRSRDDRRRAAAGA